MSDVRRFEATKRQWPSLSSYRVLLIEASRGDTARRCILRVKQAARTVQSSLEEMQMTVTPNALRRGVAVCAVVIGVFLVDVREARVEVV